MLVTTTIIESGIDIPTANTIIINRADRFGLADLYQIKGRVGRSREKAYAILLAPADEALTETARKRLRAIQELSELGAGFRIAAQDLETRGAGNLLGKQQSGHIAAVGIDLYTQMMEEAMAELRGEETRCGAGHADHHARLGLHPRGLHQRSEPASGGVQGGVERGR